MGDRTNTSPSPPCHRSQAEAFWDETRFKFILAGRRGGKTTLVIESILRDLASAPPNSDIVYIGPTLQQARELVWDAIETRMYDQRWYYNALISKSRFEMPRGVMFYVLGAEKIRRIRGHKIYSVYLDEVAYFDDSVFNIWNTVRPALTDLQGKAVCTTTPNGKGTSAYDFYLNILDKPEWKYFRWGSADNPFLNQEEIESAKRDLDEKAFKQEYLATWESFEGLAYYNFDEHKHIKSCSEFISSLPIDILLDFNVNPTTLLVAQMENGNVKVRKEYSQKNSSTISTIRSFVEDFSDRKNQTIRVFGDAAGKARGSGTGRTNYQYVEEALRLAGFTFQHCVFASNPLIVDRVMHLNAWLKNYHGESRIEIDPSCKHLIRDLSSQEVDGRHPSDKNNLGHKADALGYYTNWWTVNSGLKPQATVLL